jgi:hypothetical protein
MAAGEQTSQVGFLVAVHECPVETSPGKGLVDTSWKGRARQSGDLDFRKAANALC